MKKLISAEYASASRKERGLERASKLAVSVLEALADDHSRRMLGSAIARGRTVEQLSAETGVPISTCYRKLRVLVENGLMVTRTSGKGVGARQLVYRTSISSATLRLDSEGLGIEFRTNAAAMKSSPAAKSPGKHGRPRDSSADRRVGRGRKGSATFIPRRPDGKAIT